MASRNSQDPVNQDADYSDHEYDQEDALLAKSERSGRHTVAPKRRRFTPSWLAFGILQLLLLSFYTAVFFSLRKRDLVYSPAQGAVKYETVRYNATLVIDSPYNGPPSDEVDRAWGDLLDNMNIAVPKSDIERTGSTSIPIPGMEGMYFAGLSVFHELHCIKRLRQYTWKDHYFPNITADDERLNRLHTDHCLEILRQAVMCHADISLFTLQWSEGSLRPRADFSQEHQCANFDRINDWARERRVDASKPGILTHPVLGTAYKEGEFSKIGGSEDTSPTIVT